MISTVFVFSMAGGAPPPAAATTIADLKVAVTIEGVPQDGMQQDLRALSSLAQNQRRYTALAPVRRVADAEATVLTQALISKGFYAAQVTSNIRREGYDVAVSYKVETGPKFTLTRVRIAYEDAVSTSRPATLADANVTMLIDPDGDQLQTMEQALLTFLWDNGYPSAQGLGRHVEADFKTATATAVFPIRSGALAHFGALRISGAERTTDTHLEGLNPITAGTVYRRSDIDAYRKALTETGLFSEISIEPAAPGPDGVADVVVTLKERKHRTVGIGASFGTDVGPGATAYWENRNLRGGGEILAASLAYAAPKQTGSLTFQKPVPRLPGSWSLSAIAENEDTDAFSAQSVTLGGGVQKYFWDKTLELSTNLRYQYADITDSDGTEQTFSSVSLPLAALYNSEDSPLDPKTGHRARVIITPYFGDTPFTQVEIGGASRLGFGPQKSTMVAARLLLGATYGADTDALPATERFFAGGGGSVRGYAYQEAGPIDSDTGNPTGGSSLAEFNLEVRQQLTETVQLAIFMDTGSVFASETPDFSGDLLMGAGMGIRYITPIGPFRVDVATPLTPRELTSIDESGIRVTRFQDDPVQVYIALGQPF